MRTHDKAPASVGWLVRAPFFRSFLSMAYAYAAYVIANLLLFMIRNHATAEPPPSPVFMIVYLGVAIIVSTGWAVLLHRRKLELA